MQKKVEEVEKLGLGVNMFIKVQFMAPYHTQLLNHTEHVGFFLFFFFSLAAAKLISLSSVSICAEWS